MSRPIRRSMTALTELVSKQEEQIHPGKSKSIRLGVTSDASSSKQDQQLQNNPTEDDPPPDPHHMKGWRLYALIFGVSLSLLLSTLETTIVSTSLVSITNALQGFENRDWVVTSYLLTYTGFLVIYAKFSDIFGLKFMILLALLIFTIFSIACGAATGMTELIVLRAFQGIGGSGIYSMVGVICASAVPPEKYGKYMAIISSVFVVASVLGPVLGGAINDHSSWRWVFLLNAPAGATAAALMIIFLPSSSSATILTRIRARFTLTSFRRLDLIGVVLMLTASILLIFALEEAGTRYTWSSALILCTLTIAIISWVGFVGWEIFLERKEMVAEPIFPMRLLKDRVLVGMLLNAFFTGFPFTSLVVTLPQRFQAVNLSSPTHAGLLLLPLLLTSPVASALSGLLASKAHLPPLYLIIAGSCLQLLGVGLMTSLPDDEFKIDKAMYVYEVLMGLGFGLVLTSLLTLIPIVVRKTDMPVVMGAVTQVRVLGGTIGLAISTTVLNSFVKRELLGELEIEQVEAISQSLSAMRSLTIDQQVFVRSTFAKGYQKQIKVLLGFSGLVVLSSLLMVERKPRRHTLGGDRAE